MVHVQKETVGDLSERRNTRATVDLTQVEINELVAAHTPRHELARTPPKALSELSAAPPSALESAALTPVGQVELPSVFDVAGFLPPHESPEPFVDAPSVAVVDGRGRGRRYYSCGP